MRSHREILGSNALMVALVVFIHIYVLKGGDTGTFGEISERLAMVFLTNVQL